MALDVCILIFEGHLLYIQTKSTGSCLLPRTCILGAMSAPVSQTTYADAAKEVLSVVDAEIQALLEQARLLEVGAEEKETQEKLAQLRARLFGTDV